VADGGAGDLPYDIRNRDRVGVPSREGYLMSTQVDRPSSDVSGAAASIARVDASASAERYQAQNEFLMIENFLDPSVVAAMVGEAGALRSKINRNYVPGKKKGGSVSSFALAEAAPVTVALYQSPALMALLGRIVGEQLLVCPESDPHRCALYYYTEKGDHIGYHFDTSFYRGKRYTVLIGLIERSSSRLECQLYKDDPSRKTEELRIATNPGALVVFNGDKLWHCVTPLGENEERVVLTFEYVTDQRMGLLHRLVSDVKDAVAYFGWRSLFRRRR
jgi:hypothetical protein